MSTFTRWNLDGCGCGGGATVDVAKLINAYESMVQGLVAKLDKTEAANIYRTISDSLSKSEISYALANKADDAVVQSLRRAVEALIAEGFVTKAQGDTYWAALVNGGYAKNSDLQRYAQTSYVQDTYQTKADMVNYQTVRAMSGYASRAEIEALYEKKAVIEAEYAKKSDVPDITQFEQATAGITSQDGNAKLTGDKLLDRAGDTILEVGRVPSSEGETARMVQIGNNAHGVAFAQRPVIMVPDGTGKYVLKYLVTGDEIGTVPVGGIIRWPINWEACPSGTDIMEFLHLDKYNGEWYPCSGASIPPEAEYDEVREVLGSTVFPKESFSIIHAKAAANVGQIPADVWAMDTTVLADELRSKVLEAQALIEKYNAMIATQNTLLAGKAESSYVDLTFETKIDAAKHETIEHARDAYATRAALTQEQVRATMMEDRLNKKIKTMDKGWNEQLNSKATWNALEGERAERRGMDDSLQNQLIAEHIGCHEEGDKLRDAIENLDQRMDFERQERASVLGTVSQSNTQLEHAIMAEAAERARADHVLDKKIDHVGLTLAGAIAEVADD